MSFDGVAQWYRALETIAFGNALQRARIACLDEIGSPHRALIVGEGNGRFLCELVSRQPTLDVDCLDASARMLDLARHRILAKQPDRAGRIRFLHCDIDSWQSEHRYDLIVTHFVLDCFNEDQVGRIVARLAQAAAEDAAWLLADFRMPPAGFQRIHARAWLAVMYRFFRSIAGIEARDLVDPSPFLRAEGFALARQYLFRRGMLKSELWRRNS